MSNWFKKSNTNWGDNKLYHLINIISLQIDQFPGLIFNPTAAQLNPTSNIFSFSIFTDLNIEYIVRGRQANDRIDVVINTSDYVMVGSASYYITLDEPFSVSMDILNKISEHINTNLI